MGYDTDYKLEFDGDLNPDFNFESLDSGGWDLLYCIERKGLTYNSDWREWEDDMRALSEFNPNIIFRLTGQGEEAGDLWRAYFLGGKMHHVKADIKYPLFDPGELK